MSLEIMPSERVCYVDCNFCNTILAVSVPCSSLFNIVTVRCGHCANLLSVNVGVSVPQDDPSHQIQKQIQSSGSDSDSGKVDSGSSSSKCNKFAALDSHADQNEQPRLPPIRPPEKRQRVPSAYNKFIKEEIQRIKASNPDISHRQAFSTAAKNSSAPGLYVLGPWALSQSHCDAYVRLCPSCGEGLLNILVSYRPGA